MSLETLKGEYHIKTDPSVPPVQHPRRKTPIEYQEKIEKELNKLEQQEVIVKVNRAHCMGEFDDISDETR